MITEEQLKQTQDVTYKIISTIFDQRYEDDFLRCVLGNPANTTINNVYMAENHFMVLTLRDLTTEQIYYPISEDVFDWFLSIQKGNSYEK